MFELFMAAYTILSILHLVILWKSNLTAPYLEYKVKAHATIVFEQCNSNTRQDGIW